jgi:hypothetical protein
MFLIKIPDIFGILQRPLKTVLKRLKTGRITKTLVMLQLMGVIKLNKRKGDKLSGRYLSNRGQRTLPFGHKVCHQGRHRSGDGHKLIPVDLVDSIVLVEQIRRPGDP